MISFLQYILEVSQDDVDDVYDHVSKISPSELPFNNIFGSNYRIVIPFKEDKSDILKKKLEQQGYRVDLNKGLVYRKRQSHRGEQEVAMKIGKVLTPEEQMLWSKIANKEHKQHDADYSIILSRHPIDVLKMSDWPHLHSCHAPDGSYWHCALSEAKNGGLIAYLVDNSALKTIPNIQAGEIFSDRNRHVSGITPLGRLRVRRFTNGKIDLAIPEMRTYGGTRANITFDEFKNVVTDFFRDKQKGIIHDRPRAKDFKLAGGSYQDNEAGQLFNHFFHDQIDKHSDLGGYLNDEDADLAEQRRQEIETMDKQNNKFEHAVFAWYVENDEWGNINYMFYWDGAARFYFPDDQWIKQDQRVDYNSRNQLKRKICQISYIELDIDDIEVDSDNDRQYLKVRFTSESGNPDQYEVYLTSLKRLDNHYLETRKQVEEILIQHGYLHPSKFNQKADAIKWDQLQYFGVAEYAKDEQDAISLVSALIPIRGCYNYIKNQMNKGTDTKTSILHIKQNIKEIIDSYLKNIMHMSLRQKSLPFKDFVHKQDNTDFSVDTDVSLKPSTGQQGIDFNAQIKKVKILDNRFSQLPNIIQQGLKQRGIS